MFRIIFKLIPFISVIIVSCQSGKPDMDAKTLFTSLPGAYTGIDFVNELVYDEDFNIYTYRNFYNGGGVALGDVNNDGLIDVYLTANMKSNKLYLNKGNFKFEDITAEAGVAGERAWSTGVSMADVNGDGYLDIYVCNSGDVAGDNKQNELYINNGASAGKLPTFTEQAEAYGIADKGYSTHAAFFDYDQDGDLDLYLLNNSYQAIGSFNLMKNERPRRDPVGGDKLYRNDEDRFTDVSEQAGIYGSVIGFGLGVTVGDMNKDGWQDIYISNDFFERDYLYINQQDGTFKETLEEEMRSISGASMGADMADINNDSYPDVFVTEMLPHDDARLKTKTTFENWDRYQYSLKNGYYHQFTRNMLHLNNGDDSFSEVGRLAGVYATDWSWGALMTDLDNDGLKDIFVANGIYKDLTDQDYIQFISNEQTVKSIVTKDKVDYKKLIDYIPSQQIANYAFANQGNLTFTDKAAAWGLATPGHSNGSAYGDLDNDGDLDLVVNNINMEPFIYRNEADSLLKDHHYLKFILVGEGKNTRALGSQITLKHQGKIFYQEQMPMRGFQSSVDPRPNFGLGAIQQVDSVMVKWPGGKVTLLTDVAADQTLTLDQKDGTDPPSIFNKPSAVPTLFQQVMAPPGITFSHKENDFVDFDRDRLLFHMLSTEGPKLAKGDVNGDGLEDLYAGGAKDQAGALFVQQPNGAFRQSQQKVFLKDSLSEDTGSLFFDADGDNDIDLYVASGGSEYSPSSSALIDRLYLNDGKGNFSKSSQVLPAGKFESTSCVQAADYDGDGDQDLFVGIRLRPFLYGVPVNGYILNNDGKGNFKDVTAEIAPELHEIGMITSALWVDYDNDQDLDLIVAGEWMPVQLFENDHGKLKKVTQQAGLGKTNGLWNCIAAKDIDQDGDIDFVVGNHGLNSRFKASPEKPASMYVNDFDRNGTAEQIITVYNGEKAYPLALRHDLVMQMPGLKKKYLKYDSYKEQTIEDIFTKDQLEKTVASEVYELQTSLLLNQGDGTFILKSLPIEAQFSPVYALMIEDFDQDGAQDILLGGNFYAAKPEVGRYDASYGLFLKGDGKGGFTPIKAKDSGVKLEGQVRDFMKLTIAGKPYIIVAGNNQPLQTYKVQENYSVAAQ